MRWKISESDQRTEIQCFKGWECTQNSAVHFCAKSSNVFYLPSQVAVNVGPDPALPEYSRQHVHKRRQESNTRCDNAWDCSIRDHEVEPEDRAP